MKTVALRGTKPPPTQKPPDLEERIKFHQQRIEADLKKPENQESD
jgi:hypothetical protein